MILKDHFIIIQKNGIQTIAFLSALIQFTIMIFIYPEKCYSGNDAYLLIVPEMKIEYIGGQPY